MDREGDAVAKWSEEQLEEWARDNITKDTLPQLAWHQKQVAIWARKVLGFEPEDEAILKKARLTGKRLVLYESKDELFEDFKGVPKPALRELWAEIEKLKKSLAEPDSKKRKITQLAPNYGGDQSEGDRKAKKQKIEAKEPPEARDVFKVDEGIPKMALPPQKTVAQLIAESPKVTALNTDLPLTTVGYGGTLAQGVLSWDIASSPPFLNREDSLLELLEIAFANWVKKNDKPTIVMKATTPGSGKTRLLFEWPARAFTYNGVLEAFRTKGGHDFISTRESFLNDLWAAVHQQRVIVFQCSEVLRTVNDTDLLSHLITGCIETRFRRCALNYNGAVVTVEQLPKAKTFIEAVALFNQLIDENYPLPSTFPYQISNYKCTPLLLVLGDEIQALYAEDIQSDDEHYGQTGTLVDYFRQLKTVSHTPMFSADKKSTPKKDRYKRDNKAVHNLLLQIAELRQHNVNCMAFVTGTLQIDLPDALTNYKPVDVPMGALTDLRYLNDMCMGLFGCKLNRSVWPVSALSNFKMRELDESTSSALRRNYLKCCGQPRAIADLFRSSAANKYLTAPSTADASLLVKKANSFNLTQIDTELCDAVTKYYNRNQLGQLLELDVPEVQKLLVQAALCWAVDPKAISPIDNKSYAEIAKGNFLIPWKSTGDTIQYTYPFLFVGEKLDRGVTILQAKDVNSKNFTKMEISYNSLILPQGESVSALYDNSVKGALFEEAIAATLYARYLILSNYDYNASVKLVDLIPADYPQDSPLTHAEVQLCGVAKTTHRLNAKSTAAFEELFNKRYISVDIGNSEFADVILPVSIDGKQDQFFIGIQAKNKRKEYTAELFPNAERVLQNQNFFYMALLPGPKCEFGAVREGNVNVDLDLLCKWRRENRYMEQTCQRWLSPWCISINESFWH